MIMQMRVDKTLSQLQIATRSESKKLFAAGRVKINDEIIKNGSVKFNPERDLLSVDGEAVVYREFQYFMLNKPAGCITATEDKKERTVMDFLPRERHRNLSPVGRLDKDTEGLLVLTNDGQLAHRVLSPKKHVPKTYYAKIEGIVTEEDIKAFAKGVTLDDGYETMPAELIILKSDEISEIELTIHEGKFHQVKRMFESVDKKVIYLKRLSMGKLKLDENLALGEYRELTDEEVKMIEERD